MLSSPCEPTVKEICDHQVAAHLPFRNWCKICIDSKGKERDHKKLTKEEKEAEANALPRFGLDYAFFSEELELEEDEEKARGAIKVAVMREKRIQWASAHLAQRKGGGDEFVAQRLAKDIDTLGCNDVVIRTDQPSKIWWRRLEPTEPVTRPAYMRKRLRATARPTA